MRPFEYAAPSTLPEAIALLAEKPGATVLAGGTDLLALMKAGVESPPRLVGLRDVEELRGIESAPDGSLRIGALATIDELAAHPGLERRYPALAQAADGIRGAQVRNVGSVGGELCQRPRCWYYRNGFGLLARNAGQPMVLGGDNRYHAVLGNDGPAYFVSPSSLAPALIAHRARLKIAGPTGRREIEARELFRVPRADGEREHSLAAAEILTDVLVPSPAGLSGATYEVRTRAGLDWPLATCSVTLRLEAGVVADATAVLGHVAPIPWRSAEAEAALVGKPIGVEAAERAARAALEAARPLGANAYKVRLATVAARRAILAAAGREG
jgi:xanthine dehydrogenase YagS FAD-binding subunit